MLARYSGTLPVLSVPGHLSRLRPPLHHAAADLTNAHKYPHCRVLVSCRGCRCIHRRDERSKTKAGGERTAAGTLPLTVTVTVAVSAALIVPVSALVTVRCSGIDDAHAKGTCVEVLHPRLRRPRS